MFSLHLGSSQVVLMLYTEFQSSTMPGTGQKVCGGGGWVVVVETNYSVKLSSS